MFNNNRKIIKSNKGFTFIEVIVVIVIVAILAASWFFTGKGHVKIAMTNEGRALIDKIVAQEKIYMVQKSSFFLTKEGSSYKKTDSSKELKIDTKQNKYFKAFMIVEDKDNDGIQVIVYPADEDSDLRGVTITGSYSLGSDQIEYTENLG
jgi:prepilin-type N-terminal cleavage/methylation domain-containing protein